MFRYVWRDLVRNPRRTLVSLLGIALGLGLFSGVLFFADGSAASLTRRAIAPLTLDMQRVLTSPLGRAMVLTERLILPASGPIVAGTDVPVTLVVENRGTTPANEVVINDEPPPPLSYVQATTAVDGVGVPDVVGRSPLAQGLARTGLNIGTVAPGQRVVITYTARAGRTIDDGDVLEPRGTISTREDVRPLAANAPEPLTLAQLEAEIGRIPGVEAADGLSFVDLPSGSLHAGGATVAGPARVFGLTPDYQLHHPSIHLVSGSLGSDTAVLSVEAARALRTGPGTRITIVLPGGSEPARLDIGGIADLTAATPLFSSRKSSKLEDFLYVPNSVIVGPAFFERVVVAAFRAQGSTTGIVAKSRPVSEIDVQLDRARLHADPARALTQTEAIATAIAAIAPGQDYLIDNISNALAVADRDAAVGRRMFVFLGLPGVIAAAFLAAYTGRILAAAQRRDHANLRLRGAGPRHLRRIILWRTLLLAGVGSLAGTALGMLGALAVIGSEPLAAASSTDLAASGAVSLGVGMLATGVAIHMPSRRWLRNEIGLERRELALDPVPPWRRRRVDLALIVVAAVVEVVTLRSGALSAASTRVSLGQSPSLPSLLLFGPVAAWLAGALITARCFHWALARVRVPGSPRFGPLLRGTLVRSLRRRSWDLGTGVVGICLVIAFGITLAVFAASYDVAKAADSRFVVGGDLRITPGEPVDRPRPSPDAARFAVAGVERVSPVVHRLENAVLIGAHDQDRADLAAIDPASFADVAPLSDSFFVDGPADRMLAALAADHRGVLVELDKAEGLSIVTGDRVEVLFARGTDHQTLEELTVVGMFVRFPGFPQGVDLVVDIGTYEQATGLDQVDFFLARTTGRDRRGLAVAVDALQSGPGAVEPIRVDSTATILDKDQSSLTAFDLRGLVRLDVVFTVAMAVACIVIFVFALMLQRRREYVSLRASGMVSAEVRALVLGECTLVAAAGALAGTVVGVGVAHLFVRALRPLFVLQPAVTLPFGRIALLAAVPVVAGVAASMVAAAALARLEPGEQLREG